MSHQALYRRWRPQRFSDVVGQPYTVQTLKNAIAQGEIAHAYLFAGPRGTGKTSVARIFAKAVNCPQPQEGEPCNACPSCQAIAQGSALDVIEIDGASNRGIDQIRQLREEVNFAPAQSRYKVYIIDEVHMLTNEAFNALLKTLEEPPPHVVFLFATTEPHKVLPTVLSRCQAFEFKAISPELIVAQLRRVVQAEKIAATEEALQAIARHARGALRDALVLLDQLVSFKGGGEITPDDLYEMLGLPPEEALDRFLDALADRNAPAALALLAELAERGRDFELFTEELLRRSRDRLLDLTSAPAASGEEETALWVRLTGELLELRRELRYALDKRILLEVFVLEWTHGAPAPAPQIPASKAAGAEPTAEARTRAQPQSQSQPQTQTQPQAQARARAPIPVKAQAPVPPQPQPEASSPPQEPPPGAHDAAPQPPIARGGGSAQGVREAWERLLVRARREKAALHALLAEASPRLAEGTLFIEYPPDYTFHKERLEQPENLQTVRSLVEEIFGGVRLAVGFASPSYSGDGDSPAASQAGSASGPGSAEAGAAIGPSPPGTGRALAEKVERVRQAFEGKVLR